MRKSIETFFACRCFDTYGGGGPGASVVALRRLVFRRFVRIAALEQPGLQILRRLRLHAEPLRHKRRVLQRVTLRHAFVLEPAQMEQLMGKRVRGPAGVELLEAAVSRSMHVKSTLPRWRSALHVCGERSV